MSSEMLVLPLEGKGYVTATATQVVDRYGTALPMTISTTNVDFDSVSVNGTPLVGIAPDAEDVAVAGTATNYTAATADVEAHLAGINTALEVVADITASAAELNIMDGVTATAAELNAVDVSANTETIAESGVVSVTKTFTKIVSTGAGAITLAAPGADMLGRTKVIEMTGGNHDITLSLANVVGGSAATTCTWTNTNEALVLVGGTNKWQVVAESGVVLS